MWSRLGSSGGLSPIVCEAIFCRQSGVAAPSARAPRFAGAGPRRRSRAVVMRFGSNSVQRDHGVRVGTAGAHLGGHPDRLHDLLLARASALREPRVAADAVGALGGMRDGDRDQLLGLLRQRAVGEHLLAESLEGVVGRGRELGPASGQLAGRLGIEGVAHLLPPGGGPYFTLAAMPTRIRRVSAAWRPRAARGKTVRRDDAGGG